MPHIRFRALSAERVKKLSQDLLTVLATTIPAKEDTFTFEVINSEYFFRGEKIDGYPHAEVWWFERPQELQDLVAKIITEKIKSLTSAEDVLVTFHNLNRNAYYDNGQHY